MDYGHTFQVSLNMINQRKIIDYSKVPVALVSILKWDTIARQLIMAVVIANFSLPFHK